MRALRTLVLILVLGWLVGCGGGGAGAPPVTVTDPFAPVDRAASAAFAAQGISGMGLAIYDAQGNKRFERYYGNFSGDQRVAIASSSKLVAGLVMFRLIDQGYLSLDSTTGAVLGWSGPQAAITLRQLLSFTSGMEREAPCTLLAGIPLADCVRWISQQPLGLGSPDLAWYTFPRQAVGTSNPLIAGGIRATMNEYARFLGLVYNRGSHQGNGLIGAGLFTAQASEPYPDAVIGNSPFTSLALNFHYGLTAWLECPPPAVNCGVLSSPGAFGFTPWVDRDGGYYAIIGMEISESQSGVVNFSVQLAQDLKPLIRAAL